MKNLSLLTLALLTPMIALAGPPVKYPSCAKNIQLKSVPRSVGVFFDETCEMAYVLPPAQGTYQIQGLTPNMNLKMCPAYEATLRSLNTLHAHLEDISKQIESSQAPAADHGFGETSMDGSSSGPAAPAALKPIDPTLIEEMQKTLDLIAKIKESMKPFEDDKKGVAVGKINYSLQWDQLISDYQDANPKIHFVRLSLEAGRIVFGRKVGAAGEIVTGAVAQNIFGIDNTTGVLADGTLTPGAGSVIMGDAISGQIILNYAGACPFVKNGQLPIELNQSELENYLAANLNYQFSLQSLRKYTAKYNLASIAKHIQESHTSGGFFSSKTSNSVVESNSSSDEFNMTIESDQASYEFDANLRGEVKTELINRVLGEMAALTGQAIQIPALIPPPAHGAQATADTLQKVPNYYAQLGALAIRALDSIFGNSNAVASYIREKNGVATDTVTDKRMFHYNSSSIFVPQKN